MAVTTGTGPSIPRNRMKHPNNLRKLRIAAGITKQKQLAEQLGDKSITEWTLAMLERGHRPITDDIAPKLAGALNTTIAALTAAGTGRPKSKAHTSKKRTPWTARKLVANGHVPAITTAMPDTPPLVTLFAAAASVPPHRWTMAIRVLQAMAQSDE